MVEANKKIRLHDQRIANLLQSGKYYYDEDSANLPIRFIEKNFTFYQGPKSGEPVVLSDWQRKVIREIFGIKKKSNNKRLFTEAYIQIPRGNAKTFLISSLALYFLMMENSGEILFASNSQGQSKTSLLQDARILAQTSPALLARSKKKKLKIEAHRLVNTDTGSVIRCLTKSVGASQGLRPSFLVIDEIHESKDPGDYHNTLLTACGKISESLFFKITTAGDNLSSFCYAQYEYCNKLLTGEAVQDNFYALIYEADPELAWDSEDAIYQSNPNADISIEVEQIMIDRNRALELASYQPTYERYRLNRWCSKKETKWLDMEKWMSGSRDYSEIDLYGRKCYAGLDLSITTDLTSIVLLFPEDDGTFKVLNYNFLPEKNLDRQQRVDKFDYRSAMAQGFLEVCPGETINYEQIAQKILDLNNQFPIEYLAYDNMNSDAIVRQLENQTDIKLIRFTQTLNSFHAPSQEFEKLVLDGRFHHNNNTILNWACSNVEILRDAQMKMKPVKKSGKYDNAAYRIDPVISTIMALDCYLRSQNAEVEEEDEWDLTAQFEKLKLGKA